MSISIGNRAYDHAINKIRASLPQLSGTGTNELRFVIVSFREKLSNCWSLLCVLKSILVSIEFVVAANGVISDRQMEFFSHTSVCIHSIAPSDTVEWWSAKYVF